MRDQEHWHNYNLRSILSLACMMRAMQLSSDSNFHKVVMEIWDLWFLGSQLEGRWSIASRNCFAVICSTQPSNFASCKNQPSWYLRTNLFWIWVLCEFALLWCQQHFVKCKVTSKLNAVCETNPFRSFFCIETKYPPSSPTSGQLAIC